MKSLVVVSAIGIGCAAGLHVAAVNGRVFGGEWPLVVLFLGVLVCFGSGLLRVISFGIEEKKPRVDLAGPRPLQWMCLAFAAYGFLFWPLTGKFRVAHRFGEVFTPEKAALFYSMMISFFAMALLFHVAASAKKNA